MTDIYESICKHNNRLKTNGPEDIEFLVVVVAGVFGAVTAAAAAVIDNSADTWNPIENKRLNGSRWPGPALFDTIDLWPLLSRALQPQDIVIKMEMFMDIIALLPSTKY